ncbi:DUF2357 domain-containing protein [Celerinatantimonas sp. YJH-8]|uniref:DUF2357 domain-containing protein n=1 Tax=Celerinatantimonas sp. YJH-8 TaxID=3228714 RepID=UPI0038C3430A
MFPLELRYLDIVWRDPDTVIKLELSQQASTWEQTENGWQTATTTFPNTYHYIGVHLLEEDVIHAPYFRLSDGQQQPLMRLKAPGSEQVWWIQQGLWSKEKNRYDTEIFRTAGRIELVVQNQSYWIENNTANFTVAELERYLADFKSNLWMLILDGNSIARGSVLKPSSGLFDAEIVAQFEQFTSFVEAIMRAPGMVLSETQAKLPRRSVKPIPRTFRELAIRANQRELTSRTYYESYDTPENRFIYYAVQRVLHLLKSMQNIATTQYDASNAFIEHEKQWLATVEGTTTKRVDSTVYDNEIAKLSSDWNNLNQNLPSYLTNLSGKPVIEQAKIAHGSYTVLIGGQYGKAKRSFFVKELNGDRFREKFGTYLVVTFPAEVQDANIFSALPNSQLTITGFYRKTKEHNSSGAPYFELAFLNINSVSLSTHSMKSEIERLRNNRVELERNNWIAPLTRDEQNDLRIEMEVSRKKIAFYTDLQSNLSHFQTPVPKLQSRLKVISAFFKQNHVKVHNHCPQSMVFIQNPAYAGAKSQFKKITAFHGLDDDMLDALMLVDDIGLVNISNLYEKWCLLQIIHVLSRVYGFQIEDGWQNNLIGAVLNSQYNINISFTAPARQQSLILTYEKTLESGKRPDFMLDFCVQNYTYNQENSVWEITDERHEKLVLDAKFRGNVSEAHIHELVHELYTEKDYSEDHTNPVFIIHSSPNVIENRTSPLIWGNQCDYGQSDGAQHRYGSVFMCPTPKYGHSIDNLQRLIGLFLQKNSVILQNEGGVNWHNMVCMGCGCNDPQQLNIQYKKTKAGNDRWVITCLACGLRTIKTVCLSCHAELYKNGSKWTYHRTRAEQTSNVVCPYCEKFL